MSDLSEFVTLTAGTLTTDSRKVAKHFGKRHDSVLRAFDRLTCSEGFSRLNFVAAEELDEQGKPRRIVRMTKNGFIFLVMGFTGEKAAKIKEAYIGAFDEMAEQLQAISLDGFRSLWDQRLALEKKDATSFMWASFGAQRMVERKKALPGIRETRERLLSEMEPKLFGAPELQH